LQLPLDAIKYLVGQNSVVLKIEKCAKQNSKRKADASTGLDMTMSIDAFGTMETFFNGPMCAKRIYVRFHGQALERIVPAHAAWSMYVMMSLTSTDPPSHIARTDADDDFLDWTACLSLSRLAAKGVASEVDLHAHQTFLVENVLKKLVFDKFDLEPMNAVLDAFPMEQLHEDALDQVVVMQSLANPGAKGEKSVRDSLAKLRAPYLSTVDCPHPVVVSHLLSTPCVLSTVRRFESRRMTVDVLSFSPFLNRTNYGDPLYFH
jgi:hypothetical protein